ncbi:disintegrin and metalloproteinase domain-containing protein 8 isoform X2 [Siniperca chuatsi]|uniref:disintegrin and metalloproteinase domain-containing protein 8 isoform X2 n=1 Tax=Siniperca chuatsi TaxID=119488 RepID=UPI001CE0CC1E|nr:disintegrin and metalloproteinase domain-containing protein 8 isoform X2 [Siniperca chuatsi]
MGEKTVSLWLTWVCLVQSSEMLSHVERYEVVRPQRQKRSLLDHQLYPDTVRYELAIEGRNHTIQLEKNRNLIGRGYTETHYSEDGKRVTTSPNEEHCYYHGHIEGMKDSSVSVGICSGISGFVRARQQVYLIEPLGQSEDGDHAVYRREHLKISGSVSCASSSDTTTLYDQDQDPPVAGLFRSRSWKTTPIAGPQRFVELFVVVDNTEYKRYGSKTKSRILGVINHVDKLYRHLNIRVMLVGLEIWNYRDYIDVDINSETALDNFLLWRQTDLLRRTKHDNAQFVTGKDFDGDTVGLANKFAMCTENSGGVNQDHHDNPIGLASTIAHEMGHNFGLSHDVDARCVCGPSRISGNCVMADKLRTGSQAFPEFFSSCSVEQLAEFMERAQPSCLSRPLGAEIIALGPRCGDALLDPGEECDCGTVEECMNPCCDASTCRLTDGSQCAHGQCCDNCQFKLAGSVCRKSASDCDLPEFCTGVSGDCPEDSFEMNGKPCYNQAEGYCYNGQCPTHLQHCWRLFGLGTRVGSERCFDLNKRGEEGSNCGKNKFSYIPCTEPNRKCGSMFCEGGGESITGKRAAYTVNNIECKLPVDDDKTRNIDMVPKGTRCGPNKVCLDNRCMDLSVYGGKEDCAKKCNNKGVCNHKKECHCNPGWAPPYCDIQYEDLPQGQSGIVAGVCAVLAILLVITVVIAGLMCCKKDNMDNYTSKRKVHSAPDKLNPMFQEPGVKGRPQISQPTFMESTATQACAPLVVAVTPSRPAPQPPKKLSPVSPTSRTEPTEPPPLPPSKPLPPLNKTQYKAAKPNPPPAPPVKPSPRPAARIKPCTPPLPPAKPQLHRLA